MGLSENLREKVNSMIDEMESDTDHSRSQEFLQEYWDLHNELQEGKDFTNGSEKSEIADLLNLIDRKAKENDLEP